MLAKVRQGWSRLCWLRAASSRFAYRRANVFHETIVVDRNKAEHLAVLISRDIETTERGNADGLFFDEQRAREVDVAPLRSGTSTREAPTSARRPVFDGPTIGLHLATVLFVLAQFESAWLHTLAEVRQSDFTRSSIVHVRWS